MNIRNIISKSSISTKDMKDRENKFKKNLLKNLDSLEEIRNEIMEEKFYKDPFYAALELTWMKEVEENPRNKVYSYALPGIVNLTDFTHTQTHALATR